MEKNGPGDSDSSFGEITEISSGYKDDVLECFEYFSTLIGDSVEYLKCQIGQILVLVNECFEHG